MLQTQNFKAKSMRFKSKCLSNRLRVNITILSKHIFIVLRLSNVNVFVNKHVVKFRIVYNNNPYKVAVCLLSKI